MKINCEKLITAIKIDLIRMSPFFGHLISSLPTVFVSQGSDVPTLGIGKANKNDLLIKLYINSDYVQSLYDRFPEQDCFNHLTEVMRHEMHHIVFQHLNLNFGDKHREMIAKELSVNSYINRSMLVEEVAGQKAGVFPEDFNLPSREGTRWYYDSLDQNNQYQQMSKSQFAMCDGDCVNCPAFASDESSDSNGSSSCDKDSPGQTPSSGCKGPKKDCKGGSCSGDGDKSNDKSDKPGGTCRAKCLDSHKMWDELKDDPESGEMMKDLIRQAANTCKKNNTWGSVPDMIKSEIEKAFSFEKPAIPWQIILKQFISSSSESVLDYTMHRPSKRFHTRPGTKKEDKLKLAIGIDTSGSVSDQMISLFFNELYWIGRNDADITIFEIDTEIKREYSFREWDGSSVVGRGGTHLEPLMGEVCDRHFDALIFFSDMETSKFENRYPIPTMWVVNNSCYKSVEEMPTQDGIFLKLSNDGDSFELMK